MKQCVLLNGGYGAWAFAELADNLARELNIQISETPGDYNYILSWDELDKETLAKSFISYEGMKLASDKRLLAKVFKENNMPIPDTYLLDSYQEVVDFIHSTPGQWCIKYPIGCGGAGHRIINNVTDIPQDWLKPYLVQKFIYLDNPMVYRIYCADKNLFGWNVRKFLPQQKKQPWVAHAQGAIYEVLNEVEDEVIEIATKTFQVTCLYNSFGCADLIQDSSGNWLILEVGTDGIFNHVDRNIGNPSLEREINQNISRSFYSNM